MTCVLEVVFCDDIRTEMGNKTSLMGVYPVEMMVERLPVTLPKFCVWVNLVVPVEDAPEQISVRLMQEERIILDTGKLGMSEAMQEVRPVSGVFAASFSFALSPFQIDGPTWLQVVAECNGETLTSRKLSIRPQS